MPKKPNVNLARLGYAVIGDGLRHTLDVIARLQDQAEGTELNLLLEQVRKDVVALKDGTALSAVFSASVQGEHEPQPYNAMEAITGRRFDG